MALKHSAMHPLTAFRNPPRIIFTSEQPREARRPLTTYEPVTVQILSVHLRSSASGGVYVFNRAFPLGSGFADGDLAHRACDRRIRSASARQSRRDEWTRRNKQWARWRRGPRGFFGWTRLRSQLFSVRGRRLPSH